MRETVRATTSRWVRLRGWRNPMQMTLLENWTLGLIFAVLVLAVLVAGGCIGMVIELLIRRDERRR